MKSMLCSEGKVIICVPAVRSLYCYMDKNVGHYRRYGRGELKGLARECGFRVIENFYFNFMGIIPYWIKGYLCKNKIGSFSTSLNENNSKLYNFATAFLEPIERAFKPPVGISEFIILTPSEK